MKPWLASGPSLLKNAHGENEGMGFLPPSHLSVNRLPEGIPQRKPRRGLSSPTSKELITETREWEEPVQCITQGQLPGCGLEGHVVPSRP